MLTLTGGATCRSAARQRRAIETRRRGFWRAAAFENLAPFSSFEPQPQWRAATQARVQMKGSFGGRWDFGRPFVFTGCKTPVRTLSLASHPRFFTTGTKEEQSRGGESKNAVSFLTPADSGGSR